MKLNKSKPSLDKQEKYSIAFSPAHADKVKEFLNLTHQDYVICNNIADVIQRVTNQQVESIYLYSPEDYVLDDLPMPKSAVRIFELLCGYSGVVIFFIKEF